MESEGLWTDEQVVERFLRAKGARSQHTRLAYERDLRVFVDFLRGLGLGEGCLRRVEAGDVDGYFAELCEWVTLGQMSKATANRRMAAVSSLYRWGMRSARRGRTGMGFNPVDVDRFQVEPRGGDLGLSVEQVLELVAVAASPPNGRFRKPERNAALVRFLYVSGCRVSEVCGITWGQFREVEGGQVVVTVEGKGGRVRYVRIGAEMWGLLRGLDEVREPGGLVFGLTRDGVARVVGRVGQLVGIEGLTPHVLRHLHATHALQRGVDIKLIQETLGHAHLSTTEHYLRANPRDSSGLHLPL